MNDNVHKHEPKHEPKHELFECPNCCGDGYFIDDDDESGREECGYCNGRGEVTLQEAEDWEDVGYLM